MTRILVVLFSVLVLGGAVSPCPAESAPSTGVAFDHSAFDKILRQEVRNELVDYYAIRDRHAANLDSYLDQLAEFNPDTLSRNEQLAFYLNMYNATMIRAIAKRFSKGYKTSEWGYKIFKEKLVRLNGKSITLDDVEHKIVRPRFKDPRIHAALVCGARSCPPLLSRAFRGDDLDTVLDANMKRFINDPNRNQIDVANRKLKLSKIFKWYSEDFGGKEGLAKYVDQYHDADVAEFNLSYLPYSWDLNIIEKS